MGLLTFYIKFTSTHKAQSFDFQWQTSCYKTFFSNIIGTLIGALQADKQYFLTKKTSELLANDIEFINILLDLTKYVKKASFEKQSAKVFILDSLAILNRHCSVNPYKLLEVIFKINLKLILIYYSYIKIL